MTRVAIYVAASSPDWQRAKSFAERLQETGLVRITGTWWEAVRLLGVGRDHELSDELQALHARNDLDAVAESAIFVALWGRDKSEGLGVELGYVLGSDDRKTIVTVGPYAQRCIFARLSCVHAADDDVAFDNVMDLVAAILPKPLPDYTTGERP